MADSEDSDGELQQVVCRSVKCYMAFLEGGEPSSLLRTRLVRNVFIPEPSISYRGYKVSTVNVDTLLCAVQEVVLASKTKDKFLEIFQGKVANVSVATTRTPNFGEDYRDPKHGYRDVGLFSTIRKEYVRAPKEFDRDTEVVNMCLDRVNMSSTRDEAESHFILIFTTPHDDDLDSKSDSIPTSSSKEPPSSDVAHSSKVEVSSSDRSRAPKYSSSRATRAGSPQPAQDPFEEGRRLRASSFLRTVSVGLNYAAAALVPKYFGVSSGRDQEVAVDNASPQDKGAATPDLVDFISPEVRSRSAELSSRGSSSE